MLLSDFHALDTAALPSPCYVIDETVIQRNLNILHEVGERSGARVLAALKAFSMWSLAPLYRDRLWGTCASGLHEARLGAEFYAGEVHVYSAAFRADDLDELLTFADHVIFNSCSQWRRFRERCLAAKTARPQIEFGLRINPQHSEGATPIYDPCAPGSRLGIPEEELSAEALAGISGLHFHTLCEQSFEALSRTVAAVEKRFARWLPHMSWVNFGGGHQITDPDYDIDGLVALVQDFSSRHGCQVYLEPGEAVAIGSGVLMTEVLDVMQSGMHHAILDCSATCHMPDTLEMPYRAEISDADLPGVLAHTYRLGGLTCLAGDVMGDYSFAEPLYVGQRLLFEDMSHYTMVKTTTFNGTRLPAIAIWNSDTRDLRVVKTFDYADFRERLS